MHNHNYSVLKNIQYFTGWMKKNNCLDTNLNIRFTPINESNLTPDFNFSGRRLSIFIHEYEILYLHALFGNKKDKIYKHFIKYPLKIIKASNEKTLESPLDFKEIQPVHSKGDQPWVFFGRNDAKAETPVLWPPHGKS